MKRTVYTVLLSLHEQVESLKHSNHTVCDTQLSAIWVLIIGYVLVVFEYIGCDLCCFFNPTRPHLFLCSFSSFPSRHHFFLISPPPPEATDPALMDNSLLRKLRSNRELGLSRLEEVITKYAVRQEDTEEQERTKRLGKNSKEKEV